MTMTEKDRPSLASIWKYYQATLQFEGKFAASIPKDPDGIRAMLEHRMPVKKPVAAIPIDVLTEQVVEEVEAYEAPQPGWATFKRDDQGLYYEGRCVRGHLKDCGLQVAPFFPDVKNFRAKLVNKTYVVTDKIRLGKLEPDGTEQRFIQVLTRLGPRSSYKFIDYVECPRMIFTLKVLNDATIRDEHLRAIFVYGGTHGMGQERSQDFGRYHLESLTLMQFPAETEGGQP